MTIIINHEKVTGDKIKNFTPVTYYVLNGTKDCQVRKCISTC